MKYLSKITFLLLLSLTFFTCSEDELKNDVGQQELNLQFKIDATNSKNASQVITVSSSVIFINKKPKLTSEKLI